MKSQVIRPARENELSALVDIDDEACQLYADAGMPVAFEADHPFVLAEAARWKAAIDQNMAFVAVDSSAHPVGFIALGYVDGAPYLDQISVRPNAMRQGLGTALLRHAIAWSGDRPLWLTTYAHLAWNKPYYQQHGFVAVDGAHWGNELRAIIDQQRAALPMPSERIAMIRPPNQNR